MAASAVRLVLACNHLEVGVGLTTPSSITMLSCETQKAAGELGIIDETRDFTEQLRAWKAVWFLVNCN